MFDCELLNHAIDGKEVTKADACEIFEIAKNEPAELFSTATRLRNTHKQRTATFSKKSFFNLVNLCRDTCDYCTYKSEPNQQKTSMMSKENVRDLARLAKKYRCTEALFVTGERPEQKYQEAREWLKENGFSSTAEYLTHASEIALSEGLFPHTNAGNLTKSEINDLKRTNVSMGLMLENSSDRLTKENMPHHLAPSKNPRARLQVLENAGDLNMPMTTGLLVGIGETPNEVIDSIFEIKKLHQRYGHIQEVILQNFQPKHDTKMGDFASAEENYFKIIVALTRVIMPQMNIQIPPNLSPDSYQSFLQVGINDWGGISPLTPDYVNPEFSWPKIEYVAENTENAGYELKARFPVYPEFMHMVNSDLHDKMSEIMDEDGWVREAYWK
ncbi:7,8-didemethyl-8-hydroxy-5-deazariboflavin synthase subunit CofG [Candidatus Nitrosotenuis chungbukensis]|uniref:7,8-didemethyl-8-hydroxy-5-deazariboflavin synthase subunit CofG n=1 Tax=Candidatus Nitrosotenuis chungbukensis TaxID=1353246 RepID=UPI000A767263|nr:7,8-didemethyl-8-hydroxy-5-deazariboflavin synthase subunit CofG [Candidatus Nitrosotenuis chungbukensis]WKT57257.1 7,8-didemethyl-8-hydroxy-5-deazariboflavin synthase subunit CofG [Candidatus Nitrosotenuis chungbukensis]